MKFVKLFVATLSMLSWNLIIPVHQPCGVLADEQKSTANPDVVPLKTLQEGEDLRKLEEALRMLEELGDAAEKSFEIRKKDCLKAFGYRPFCECLCDKMPWVLSFQDYIGIVTRTKTQVGYDQMSDEEKGVVDKVYSVRDECVSKAFAK